MLGQAHKLVHAVGRFVGQTHSADLAVFDELGQGFKLLQHGGTGFVFGWVKTHLPKDGCVAGGPVDLVEVDHVGLQAAQAAFAGSDDFGPREA